MMDLKDKLDLLLKFLFLVVFAYGVVCFTCCKKSCSYSSGCKIQSSQVTKSPCGANCIKPCCAK